jgi:hypothetical protein
MKRIAVLAMIVGAASAANAQVINYGGTGQLLGNAFNQKSFPVSGSGQIAGFTISADMLPGGSGGSWQSDMMLTIVAPNNSTFNIGGYSTPGYIPWTGAGGTGTFPAGTGTGGSFMASYPFNFGDVNGTWSVTLKNDWDFTGAGNMLDWNNIQITLVQAGPSGACCLPSGSCEMISELACSGSGGTWSGAASTCTPGLCPQPGACWLLDGCAIVMEGVCTYAAGTFQGGGSTCASFPLPAGVLYINGPMATGASTGNGVPAPGGNQWSECAHPYDIPPSQAPANTTAGFRVASATDRIADDFTIPAGESWQINNVVVYAYQTGSSTVSSFTGATLRIWDGPPNVIGSNIVWGDTSTNRMTSTQFSGIYRAFSSVVAAVCGGAVTPPTTDRPIMELVLGVNTLLPAGTYWVDYNTTGTLASGPWAPPTTVRGTRAANTAANALQSVNSGLTWAVIQDAGQGCGPAPVTQDYAFRIRGEKVSACYANCDNSTTAPVLNVEDFTCFINKFAQGCP